MTTWAHKEDYADDAERYLYRRFRTPRTVAFARACAHVAQLVEDDINTLISATLETATGELLARYGRLVGLDPTAAPIGDDETYRRLISAQILINTSEGTRYQLREIVARLLGIDITKVRAWGLEGAGKGPAVIYVADMTDDSGAPPPTEVAFPTDEGGPKLAQALDTARPAGEALDLWVEHLGGFRLGSSALGTVEGTDPGLALILRP